MTGMDIVERALMLLNYTTPAGVADMAQNAEQLRRALPIVNTVLMDVRHIQRLEPVQVGSLSEELPLDADLCWRVMVPGVAMYLAQSENDGDNYNRFSLEYAQRRSSVPKEERRIQDVIPQVWA